MITADLEKERFQVNRIYFGAVVMAAAVGVSAVSVSAADASIMVQLDKETVEYTYTPGSEEYERSIKDLFNSFEDVTALDTVKKDLTVTSISPQGESLVLSLRLSIAEADAALQYSPLDYYDFKITDTDDNVIYDSEEAESSDIADTHKDITLGVFNDGATEDTKEYVIEYGINEEAAAVIGDDSIEGLDIELVSAVSSQADDTAGGVVQGTAPVATLKPKFELTATAAPQETAAAAESTPTEAPLGAAPTEIPEADSAKVKTIICGEDIAPGRYTVTGNANVRITTKDGEIISETTVTDGSDENVKGVKQFITSLEEGDIITITPISDEIKAAVNFEKTNSGSSSDTKNLTAASTTGRNTASPSATASSKTNPKTGDVSTTTAALASAMVISAAAAGCLEIVKRKKTVK